jgi:hypothetical protein
VSKIRRLAKKVPVLPLVYRSLRGKCEAYQLQSRNTEEVFTEIFQANRWGGKHSVSGTGSDSMQTGRITRELPIIISDLNVSTMLDIPCGDFYWMRNVDMSEVDYIGADIVKELIRRNEEEYKSDRVRFQQMNLISDKLPRVDLIFCRDCLVHLSFADIFLALHNMCESQSKYLLTTTFTARKSNRDIATGQWRVLNLEVAPLMLPEPERIVNEGCTEEGIAFADKALGLWRIADIRETLRIAVPSSRLGP